MTSIEISADAKAEFSGRLEKIMKRKGVFEPETHIYLTDVMMKYVKWEDGEFSPSVHTRTTDAFFIQMMDAQARYFLDSNSLYARMRAIGETILFSVGYWPESISSTPTRERPDLEYYAATGAKAYKNAANAKMRKSISDAAGEVMTEMAQGFRQYAAVLCLLRQETGMLPFRDVEMMFKMSEFLKEPEVLNRYVLSTSGKF